MVGPVDLKIHRKFGLVVAHLLEMRKDLCLVRLDQDVRDQINVAVILYYFADVHSVGVDFHKLQEALLPR